MPTSMAASKALAATLGQAAEWNLSQNAARIDNSTKSLSRNAACGRRAQRSSDSNLRSLAMWYVHTNGHVRGPVELP